MNMLVEELFRTYEESPSNKSVKESWKECRQGLNVLPKDAIEDIEKLIHNYAGKCEESAFTSGLYYGIRLIFECMPTGEGLL